MINNARNSITVSLSRILSKTDCRRRSSNAFAFFDSPFPCLPSSLPVLKWYGATYISSYFKTTAISRKFQGKIGSKNYQALTYLNIQDSVTLNLLQLEHEKVSFTPNVL